MACRDESGDVGWGVNGIAPRQRDLLAFMIQRCLTDGKPPTIREIMAALGYGDQSMNAIHEHMQRLQAKGYASQTSDNRQWWPCRDLAGNAIRWRLTFDVVPADEFRQGGAESGRSEA